MRLFKLEQHQRYISNEKKIYIRQIKNMGTSTQTDVLIFIQSTNSNENMKKIDTNLMNVEISNYN